MFNKNTATVRLTAAQVAALADTPVEIAPGLPGQVHVALRGIARRTVRVLAAPDTYLAVGTDVASPHIQFQSILHYAPASVEVSGAFAVGSTDEVNATLHVGLPLVIQVAAGGDTSETDMEVEVSVEYMTFAEAMRQPKRGYHNSNNDA